MPLRKHVGSQQSFMLRCTGEEGVSEPFLSNVGGPWGALLAPSFVCPRTHGGLSYLKAVIKCIVQILECIFEGSDSSNLRSRDLDHY